MIEQVLPCTLSLVRYQWTNNTMSRSTRQTKHEGEKRLFKLCSPPETYVSSVLSDKNRI